MYTDRHRLAYQLFCVALLAVNIAVGLGAELDLPDVPKDLWCTDITEYCNRYLDIPRPECIEKLKEVCIENPASNQPNNPNHTMEISSSKPVDAVKPSTPNASESPSTADAPQWIQDLVSDLFKPKN